MTDTLQLLRRSSTPAKALVEPAPTDAELEKIFEIAMTAPDHGRLRPYRFITIRGEDRKELSAVFANATKRRDPEATEQSIRKQRDKPLRSPLIVVVVAQYIESPKIPQVEQLLSAGAATHNILLASNALGFGSVWLTGDNAYDQYVRDSLEVKSNEAIVGFVYLGTDSQSVNRLKKTSLEGRVRRWP
ncbi:MAG: nitroreductase [Gammaproteobacteria bacterium]|jgi:nitroreductase